MSEELKEVIVGAVDVTDRSIRSRPRVPHHVEQYAVTWTIALGKVLSPIAATQAPVAAVLRLFAPIGCAVVLGIEAYEVHADSGIQR